MSYTKIMHNMIIYISQTPPRGGVKKVDLGSHPAHNGGVGLIHRGTTWYKMTNEQITMIRKSGKHIRKHWTDVLTLLGFISSVYRDLHYWSSNQRPQSRNSTTEPQSISHTSDAKLTSYGNCWWDLMSCVIVRQIFWSW